MGQVDYRDGIAILQLIIFGPCILQAIYLCFRHGLSKAGGSLLLVSFMLTRITGASCQLASIKHPSEGLLIAELVCLYIGLSPLTLVCWGVLQRINNQVPREIPSVVYTFTTIVSLTGLGLGIYGAVKASSSGSTTVVNWNAYSKAAIVIFTVVFIATVFAFLFIASQARSKVILERRLLIAVLVSIPLIAVRLAYALLGEWSGQKRWNPYFGNVTYYLCLAVLEEILVVLTMVITLSTVSSFRGVQKGLEGFQKRENAQIY